VKEYGASSGQRKLFLVSVAPDQRFSAMDSITSNRFSVGDFEVIQKTDQRGPRSPGAPVADAGLDQTIAIGADCDTARLGSVSSLSAQVQWQLDSGPGSVAFGDASRTNTTVGFSRPRNLYADAQRR